MKQILLVEDNANISIALAIRLRDAGYHVMTAADPVAGVELALRQQPDLIITDIYMPKMDGFHFIGKLQQLGLKKVPFIFITGSQKNGLWETAQELGATGYFEKPYDPLRIMAAVENLFQESCPAPSTQATL